MIPISELYLANKEAGHAFSEIGANQDRTRIILRCERCELLLELYDQHIWELGRGVLFGPAFYSTFSHMTWQEPLTKCSTTVMKNALK